MNKRLRAALSAHGIKEDSAKFRLPSGSSDIEIIYMQGEKEKRLNVVFGSNAKAKDAYRETFPGAMIDMDVSRPAHPQETEEKPYYSELVAQL